MSDLYRTGQEPTWDIFLSYPSDAVQATAELYQLLCQAGVNPFFAEESKGGYTGEDWERVVTRALDKSKVIAAVISSQTTGATYQRGEIIRALNRAKNQGIRVVPVMLTGTTEKDMTLGLEIYQGLWQDRSARGLRDVAQSLARLARQPHDASRHMVGAV